MSDSRYYRVDEGGLVAFRRTPKLSDQVRDGRTDGAFVALLRLQWLRRPSPPRCCRCSRCSSIASSPSRCSLGALAAAILRTLVQQEELGALACQRCMVHAKLLAVV